MKKVFLVFALVAAYGVSMAMSGSDVITVDDLQVTIVADMNDNNVTAPEGEKAKEKAKTADAKAAKADGCGGEKSAAKADGCGGEKSAAKADGCSGEKSAAKADCGDKTKTAVAEKK
jgi:hypothetical protein